MNKHIPPSNDGQRHILDVPGLARELHLQMQRYIQAQYPIRHPELIVERQELLKTAGVLSQEPFIESMPGYVPGPLYADLALSPLFTGALTDLSTWLSPPVPSRLYQHQAKALETFFRDERDLILVTGTGSGKTETFLLPILLRSIAEAKERPQSFRQPGMRALLLYPMNALVNDQLTRLRRLFGDPRWVSWFRQHCGAPRPVRFSMYTSRTPYPGELSKKSNEQKLLPLLNYYLALEGEQEEHGQALKQHGRWPALDLAALREASAEGKTHIGEHDCELYTRHQVQAWCPDILVTNYSMLEYMLMRPIEQSIFQQTAEWLREDPGNTLLIVLDEAHLYNGVVGAEIALLLRRLHARLGIDRERSRYILTSASLDPGAQGERGILAFAATLVGKRSAGKATFAIIQGQRVDPPEREPQTKSRAEGEASALAAFDLSPFASRAADPEAGRSSVVDLADQLNWPAPPEFQELAGYLGQQLPGIEAFRHLWEKTAGRAQSFYQLSHDLFPAVDEQTKSRATSTLLSLSAAASLEDGRPLLPVRAHLFFRGLPPLYACVNPQCSARRGHGGGPGVLGALGLSPRLHCTCGARVFELYAHRNCGAVFLRVFAPVEPADFYWHEPGARAGEKSAPSFETFLLIGQPHPSAAADACEPIYLHMLTGRVIPAPAVGEDGTQEGMLLVYRPLQTRARNNENDPDMRESRRHWKSCPVCQKRLQEHSITSLATKGEQPFVNLVRRQFELQPPGAQFQDTTPNMGRKLLLFSDGRQKAARLARDLPREVELDTFRQALLLAVARIQRTLVNMNNELYREFVAVCAEYHLYFFDGDSQQTLLRTMQALRETYADIAEAREDGWDPPVPQGYRVALLRQVADRFYSMQRMCAAVVEPAPGSLRQLKRKPVFSRLEDHDLRALAISWVEELLEVSAFDVLIASADRENTVPGSGFPYTTTKWNDAEEAARDLLGYSQDDLQRIRQAFIDELCEKSGEYAFLKPEKLALRLTLEDSWQQCKDCTRLLWLPLRGRCSNPRCSSRQLIELPGDDLSLRARTDFYREPLRQFIAGERVPMHLTAEEHTAQLSHRDMQQVSTTTEEYELRFQDIGLSSEKPAIDVLSCTTTMEVGIDIGSLLGIGLRTMPPRRANYQQRAGRAGRRSATLATVLTFSENGSHDAHYFLHPEEMIAGALPCPQIPPINERLTRRHLQAALIQTFFHEQLGKAGKLGNRQYSYLAEALGRAATFFLESGPYSLANFETWLEETVGAGNPRLSPHLIAWLPDTSSDQALDQHQRRALVQKVAHAFVEQLHRLAQRLFPPEAETSSQDETKADEVRLLDVLFEHGFLPTYAFPREVRDFVIEKRKPGSSRVSIEQRPERSVDIALSEYAPGRELIVNKATYRVGGIYTDPFPGATVSNRVSFLFQQALPRFAFCLNCGYARHQSNGGRREASQCPQCQAPLNFPEILDPPGFAPPEPGKPLEQGQIHDEGAARGSTGMKVRLVLPQDSVDAFHRTTAGGRIAWSEAEHRELLIVNSGPQNDGFAICRMCGAAAPGNPDWLQRAHKRPFYAYNEATAPQKCHALLGIWRGFLGHVFHSDLLLLRFQWPRGVAYEPGLPWMHEAFETIAQALLLAAARLLDISTAELQAGWSYTIAVSQMLSAETGDRPVIYFFLFDTLSGGAGYATQVGTYVDELLREAQRILDHCPEQCERSCYRCLRTYYNRIHHHLLDRRLAGRLLRAIVSGQPPEASPVAQQAAQLEMLQRYLELAGVHCQREEQWRGETVPLLLERKLAVGVYPVQQDRQEMGHPLDTLPASLVRLLSDYALAHELPRIAESLLEFLR